MAKHVKPKAVANKAVGVLTLHGVGKMTPKGRKIIADWLRNTAKFVLKKGDKISGTRFTSRYFPVYKR